MGFASTVTDGKRLICNRSGRVKGGPVPCSQGHARAVLLKASDVVAQDAFEGYRVHLGPRNELMHPD